MKNSISKVKVESWFIRVGFFSLKNRELKNIGFAAIEVPAFNLNNASTTNFPDTLWLELFRYYSRYFSKRDHCHVCFQSYEIFTDIDEARDEGLPLLRMSSSFLRKHHLVVVDSDC